MNLSFSQLCSASPAAYTALRRYIDERSRLEGGCEFENCEMPPGCVPGRAVVGFSRQGSAYLLYWKPSLSYHGQSRVLAIFFSRSVWRFDTYETMAGRLLSLRRETAPHSPQPYRPQPLRPDPPPAAAPWPPLYCRLRDTLLKNVMGQEAAVEAVAYRLFTHVGKKAPARPLSMIFYGPTGVGKSELGKTLAPALEQCCARRYQFVWTELNTFTQPHSVHRLTGAPPGYVGYEDQPIFEAVRQNPYTVFMFDELEKAHPEILKVFMSILDEGRCTAHRAEEEGGRELDFRRCVFVFTTNADLSAAEGRSVGFSDSSIPPKRKAQARKTAATPAELAERLFQENESARRAMVRLGVLQEIAGRFSGIIGFQPLDAAARVAITEKQIRALGQEYGLYIAQVDPETVRALTPEADTALSARSSLCVLESLLTPLMTSLAASGRTSCRLSGLPGNLSLRPLPAHCSISNSCTELLSTS